MSLYDNKCFLCLCFVLFWLSFVLLYLKSLTVRILENVGKIRHNKHMKVKKQHYIYPTTDLMIVPGDRTHVYDVVFYIVYHQGSVTDYIQAIFYANQIVKNRLQYYSTEQVCFVIYIAFKFCLLTHIICIGKVQLIDFINSTFVFKLNSHFATLTSQTKKGACTTTVYPKYY